MPKTAEKKHVSNCPKGRAHYWVLQETDGGIAPAVCRRCNAEKTFNTKPVRVEWNA